MVGWAATLFIIISFLINNMLWLRIINMVGASLWLTYGIIDTSYSIIFLNVIIVSIQFYKISVILKPKKHNLNSFKIKCRCSSGVERFLGKEEVHEFKSRHRLNTHIGVLPDFSIFTLSLVEQ